MNNENQVSVNKIISQENSVDVSTTSKNECFDVEQNINSYYSNLAKSWACKEDNMVDGEYFSAKYYAKSAQKYLEDFKNYSEKYLNHLQITNCLLEVPQNIKLELNNGVLTLKAGSKVIVPNGAGVFEEKVITRDLSHSSGAAQGTLKRLIYVHSSLSNIGTINVTSALSGSEMSNYTWQIWYDTTNNVVNKIDATAGQVAYTCGFPLGEVTIVDGVITSIDQVFNGFGYIGSTIWVDKGVKGLIPNGRNDDGSLKNIEVTTSKVSVQTLTSINDRNVVLLASGKIDEPGGLVYSEAKNRNYNYADNYTACDCGTVKRNSNGVITSLDIKQPFRAVDYNDKTIMSGWAMPSSKYVDLTLGASDSNYTAPANGWVAFSRTSSASGQYITLNSSGLLSKMSSSASSHTLNIYLPVKKGATYKVSYNTPTAVYFRFILAEGEI